MGWIKGRYFNEDGILTTYHFCWAEGMGYLLHKSLYWKTFHRKPPHWLLIRRIDDQISLLRKAVETGKALPEIKSSILMESDFGEYWQ